MVGTGEMRWTTGHQHAINNGKGSANTCIGFCVEDPGGSGAAGTFKPDIRARSFDAYGIRTALLAPCGGRESGIGYVIS